MRSHIWKDTPAPGLVCWGFWCQSDFSLWVICSAYSLFSSFTCCAIQSIKHISELNCPQNVISFYTVHCHPVLYHHPDALLQPNFQPQFWNTQGWFLLRHHICFSYEKNIVFFMFGTHWLDFKGVTDSIQPSLLALVFVCLLSPAMDSGKSSFDSSQVFMKTVSSLVLSGQK